jgi:hypothetical protein
MKDPDKVLPPLFEIARSFPFIHVPAAPIAHMLNQAVDVMLSEHPAATHFVNLDIDHVHPANVVQRLGHSIARYPEIRIIGGLNFQRGAPHSPCAWFRRNGGHVQMTKWLPGITEVSALGFGCVMIAREVFEQIPPPWFMYDYSDMQAGINYQYPGSDAFFCKQARKAGIKIYCDTTLTSPHISEKLVGENEYKNSIGKEVLT